MSAASCSTHFRACDSSQLWILGVQPECFMHLTQVLTVEQKRLGSPLHQGGQSASAELLQVSNGEGSTVGCSPQTIPIP